MSKIKAAKLFVRVAIGTVVDSATRTLIANNTEIERDSIPAHIAGGFVGGLVAASAGRYTDPMVDAIIEKFSHTETEDTETPES